MKTMKLLLLSLCIASSSYLHGAAKLLQRVAQARVCFAKQTGLFKPNISIPTRSIAHSAKALAPKTKLPSQSPIMHNLYAKPNQFQTQWPKRMPLLSNKVWQRYPNPAFVKNDPTTAILVVITAAGLGTAITTISNWLNQVPPDKIIEKADETFKTYAQYVNIGGQEIVNQEIDYTHISEADLEKMVISMNGSLHGQLINNLKEAISALTTQQVKLAKCANKISKQKEELSSDEQETLNKVEGQQRKIRSLIAILKNRKDCLSFHNAYFKLGEHIKTIEKRYTKLATYIKPGYYNDHGVQSLAVDPSSKSGKTQFPILDYVDWLNHDICSIIDQLNATPYGQYPQQHKDASNVQARLESYKMAIVVSPYYQQTRDHKRTSEIDQEEISLSEYRNALQQKDIQNKKLENQRKQRALDAQKAKEYRQAQAKALELEKQRIAHEAAQKQAETERIAAETAQLQAKAAEITEVALPIDQEKTSNTTPQEEAPAVVLMPLEEPKAPEPEPAPVAAVEIKQIHQETQEQSVNQPISQEVTVNSENINQS